MAKSKVAFFCLLALITSLVDAQGANEYEQRVRDMVNFLEYVLNTLGSKETNTRDKDVIINQSYTKVFRDAKVQVEDDLVANRQIPINKDIVAYLKDVDFFFKDASFDLEIVQIESLKRENGDTYFKVEVNRSLKALTLDGDNISNSQKRYIEINLDPKSDDLKIASIYTTKISMDKQLEAWWLELSYEWNKIFKIILNTNDKVELKDLYKITTIDSLDISGNSYILDVEPLYILSNLKYLNISSTRVSDLGPLRSSGSLETLIANETEVYNLEYLKYLDHLKVLNIANTRVRDISPLIQVETLTTLNLSGDYIADFSPLSALTELSGLDISNSPFSAINTITNLSKMRRLDLSNSLIRDISGLTGMNLMEELDLEQTDIDNIQSLKGMSNLSILNINQTGVNTLAPLSEINTLSKIYCDNTGIEEQEAQDFMSRHKGTVVINNSRKVAEWWQGLDYNWKSQLARYIPGGADKPTKEDLVILLNSDSINLANTGIITISPLESFRKLKYLDVSNNRITELSPIANLDKLESLLASGTFIKDVTPLKGLKNLRIVNLADTKIRDIYSLSYIQQLTYLNVDATMVSWQAVKEFKSERPECDVIFDTKYLINWWQGLEDSWKQVFRQNHSLSKIPSSLELHQLVALESINIQKVTISNFKPLWDFISIKELSIQGVNVTDLSTLPALTDLQVLICNQTPIQNVAPLGELHNLRKLNIANTAVEDLRTMSGLKQLEEINCSGTVLTNLRGLEGMESLRSVDCSNTKVNRLDPLFGLKNLNELICYNTRLNQRDISNLREYQPDCEIVFY